MYQEPRFPGPVTLGGAQHLSTGHFRSLTTSCYEAAMGSQVSSWWMMLDKHWCWRSLWFLGSLSFVYFSCSMFLFCPLGYSARTVPLSHILYFSQTWAVSSVAWEDATLVWAQKVAPHFSLKSKCSARSLKDLNLEGTHISTFHLWKSWPEQSKRNASTPNWQCGGNRHDDHFTVFNQHPFCVLSFLLTYTLYSIQHIKYFCLLDHLLSLWLYIMGCFAIISM